MVKINLSHLDPRHPITPKLRRYYLKHQTSGGIWMSRVNKPNTCLFPASWVSFAYIETCRACSLDRLVENVKTRTCGHGLYAK